MFFRFSLYAQFLILTLLLSLIACEQQLRFDPAETKKMLVVTGIVGPDSIATIYFTETQSYEGWVEQSRDIVFPQDLVPNINANGKIYPLTGSIDPFGRYYYRTSELLPDSGTYRLDLMFEGDSLSANTRVPSKPKVDNLTYEYTSVKLPYTNQIRNMIRIYFDDTPGVKDAYQLNHGANIKREESRFDSNSQTIYIDTISYNSNNLSLLISDQGMDGQRLHFDINPFYELIPQQEIQADGNLRSYQLMWLILIAHTPDRYEYFTSTQRYFWGFGDDPFQEPVLIYDNIQNGSGIFTAYHSADTIWMKIYLD